MGYRMVIVAPAGDVVGTVGLDGYDLNNPYVAPALLAEIIDALPSATVTEIAERGEADDGT